MKHDPRNWRINDYPKYESHIREAEHRYRIPSDLLARLLFTSSRFDPETIAGTKRNPVGAIGIAQLMPDVAARMNVNRYDPLQSIHAAARHLKQMYEIYHDWKYAILAYQCTPEHVKKNKLQPESHESTAQILADIRV